MKKRILSAFLSLVMLVTMLPTAAAESVEQRDDAQPAEMQEEQFSKQPEPMPEPEKPRPQSSASLLARKMTYTPYPGATYDLTYWENADGTLTISGWTGTDTGNLVIPDAINGKKVTTIGPEAFFSCRFTGSLTIPNSVTTIGDAAFKDCYNITGVTIGNSVKVIGKSAFESCWDLTGSLTIPASVTTIGGRAFSDCDGTEFIVASGNTSFCSLDGILFTKDMDTAVACLTGKTGTLTIPYGVTTIADGAFFDCRGFTGSLTIPNSVETIGEYAFYRCRGFTGSLTIGNGVTTIGNGAFNQCSGFTGSLTIPASVTTIGDWAFHGCSGFTGSLTIGNGVTTIGNGAFDYCDGFTGSLTIPNRVETIGEYAFYRCSGFTGSLTIGNGVTTIGQSAFAGCGGFVGSLTIPTSVTTIRTAAFNQCSGFTGSLTIPDSVTTIGYEAFKDCRGFTGGLTIGNGVTIIEPGAFQGCSGFTGNLTIGNSVTTIGDWAFRGCSGFTGNLVIPDSVTTIVDDAFANCRGFTGSLTIGSSVTTIRDWAFSGCSGIKHAYFKGNAPDIRFRALDEQCILYYIEGKTGWTDSADYDAAAGTWKGYQLKTWDGSSTVQGIKSLLPHNGSTIDLDNQSGGGLYRDGKPRIFFDRELVTTKGNVQLDFSKGTLKIQRASDGAVVYEVRENTTTPGTSLDLLLWGHQPPYQAIRLESVWFRLDYGTEYYVTMPEGFIQFTDGSVSPALVKGDWQFRTADKAPIIIAPLSPAPITINGKGYAIAIFRLADAQGNAEKNRHIQYSVDGSPSEDAVTDGDGILAIRLPEQSVSKKIKIRFHLPQYRGPVDGLEQVVDVRVKPFSYSQKWTGALNVEAEAGLGAGGQFNLGPVDAEAYLLKGSLKGAQKGTFSMENSYEGTDRTLELTYSFDSSAKSKIKTGVEATIPESKLDIASVSGECGFGDQSGIGLKISGDDWTKGTAMMDIGCFGLEMALMGSGSVISRKIQALVPVGAHNQSSCGYKVVLDAGGKIMGMNEWAGTSHDFSIAAGSADLALGYTLEQDFEEKTRTKKASIVTETGGGLFQDFLPGTDGMLYGKGDTNATELEVTGPQNADVNEIISTYYDEGKKDVLWSKMQQEKKTKTSFSGEQARQILQNDATLNGLANGSRSLLSGGELTKSTDHLLRGPYQGRIEHILTNKKGLDLNLPIGVGLGASLELSLGGSLIDEYSIETSNGIFWNGNEYKTAKSTVSEKERNQKMTTPAKVLGEPMEYAAKQVGKWIKKTWGKLTDGVSNAFSKVSSAVFGWVAEVSRVDSAGGRAELQSYAILAVDSDQTPVTDAAVSMTLGDPYSVAIYTDETKTALVPDEQLAANPFTVTLEYTDAMLQAAGASPAASINIYWFDAERNVYVYQSGSRQDKTAHTVTVQADRQGEYILATDNASPLISDFRLSNQTATPEMSVLASDLSGFSEFRFWLDTPEEPLVENCLVTEKNMGSYYDTVTGIFTYQIKTPLSSGEHTAYFRASDALGNTNAKPFQFTFTVDAEVPVITGVTVPADPVTALEGFTVSANVMDNQQLSSVTAVLKAAGQEISVPMSQNAEGAWTAQVRPLPGKNSAQFFVLAVDAAGNKVQSAEQTVMFDLPATDDSIKLECGQTVEDGMVTVTLTNGRQKAGRGLLVCAAYDANGRMLDTVLRHIGFGRGESAVYQIPANFGPETKEIKAFLLNEEQDWNPMAAIRKNG